MVDFLQGDPCEDSVEGRASALPLRRGRSILDPLWAIVLISVAGPVTGSALGVIRKSTGGVLENLHCFAAGVMLAISFLELLPEGVEASGTWLAAAGFLGGTAAMFGMETLLPHIHPSFCQADGGRNLQRTAVFLIAGIFLHNFPEGMAIAIGAVTDVQLSFTIALAIAIHNVPEGICTAAPYYKATGSRWKAFLWSSSTALPLLAGFLIARYLFLNIPGEVLGVIVSATAGFMIYIAADELIPAACFQTRTHGKVFSLASGVLLVLLLGH